MDSLRLDYGTKYGEAFQRHILAVAVKVPGFVLRFRSALDPSHFASNDLRLIADRLFEHADKFHSLPTHPLLAENVRAKVGKDDAPRVLELLGTLYTEAVDDAEAVMAEAVAFGKHRALILAVLRSGEEIDRGKYEKVEGNIRTAQAVGEDLLDVGTDYFNNAAERARYVLDPTILRKLRISTGMPHLDYAMKGGLARGEMGVVLGPAKRGKSTSLINFGFAGMAAGLKVVHYTIETEDTSRTGYAVSRAGYDVRLMHDQFGLLQENPAKWIEVRNQRLAQLKARGGALFVKSYPSDGASVSKLRAHLYLLSSRGFVPDVIVMDYADLLNPEGKFERDDLAAASVYRALRGLGQEINAAVWTASQTNRGGLEKETVTIADFGESFKKAQIADAVIAFCQTKAEKAENRARFFLAALRFAADGGTVDLQTLRETCYIRSTGLYDAANVSIILGEAPKDATPKVGSVAEATKELRHEFAERNGHTNGAVMKRPAVKKSTTAPAPVAVVKKPVVKKTSLSAA